MSRRPPTGGRPKQDDDNDTSATSLEKRVKTQLSRDAVAAATATLVAAAAARYKRGTLNKTAVSSTRVS